MFLLKHIISSNWDSLIRIFDNTCTKNRNLSKLIQNSHTWQITHLHSWNDWTQ